VSGASPGDMARAMRCSLVFSAMDEEERVEMVRRGTQVVFAAGTELFHPGEPCDAILVVVRGHVRLWRTTRSGHVLVLRHCEAGEVLGQMSALDGTAHSVGATCVDEVKVLRIGAEHFRALLEHRPRLAMHLARALASRVRDLSDQLEAMKFSSIGERVVALLRRRSAGLRELKTTHEELAHQVGSTRENVSRVLGLLRDQQIVILHRGRIEIIDPDRLGAFEPEA